MAITKNEYLEQYKKKNQATLNSGVTLLQQAAQKEKEAVDKVVDRNLELAGEEFAINAGKLEDSVADAREKNAVQRALTERQIKERMSRLGLSDSGYNESLTAGAENLYKKTARDITAEEKMGFDSLARALRLERESQEATRDSKKQTIDSNLATDVSKLYTDFNKDAEDYAKDHVDDDVYLEDAYRKALEDNYDDKLAAFNDATFRKKYDKYVSLYGEEEARNIMNNLGISAYYKPNETTGNYEAWSTQDWVDYIRAFKKQTGYSGALAEYERLENEGVLPENEQARKYIKGALRLQ